VLVRREFAGRLTRQVANVMLAGTMRAPLSGLWAAARSGFVVHRALVAHSTVARCATMDQRSMSTKPPTAIVMMNMGGPSTQEEVHPFLYNLFTDRQIMQMPMQQTIGAWLAPFPCSAESDYPFAYREAANAERAMSGLQNAARPRSVNSMLRSAGARPSANGLPSRAR
jgi:hypothetical protein